MFSYAGKTQKEIDDFKQKVSKDREAKYSGKIDNETLRWVSSEAQNNAIYMPNAQRVCVNIRVGKR